MKDKWIKIKDKKPEINQRIIIYVPPSIGIPDMGVCFYEESIGENGEIYWMDAPKPPETKK